MDPNLVAHQYEAPYGMVGPPINHAMARARQMQAFGKERTRQGMTEVAR